MKVRLRPKHSDELLRRIYATPHQHTRWLDHITRVAVTTEIADFLIKINGTTRSIADLSCGDGTIATSLAETHQLTKYLGDFAPKYQITGPLEETLDQLQNVDLYICSETLEHLDDPELVLAKIRKKARMLVLSTPIYNHDDGNIEHYWSWDYPDVNDMLHEAGFHIKLFNLLDFRNLGPEYYCFGIWACS